MFHKAMLLVLLAAVPTSARAGWVSEWTNTAFKSNGDRVNTEQSSMSLASGHMRMDQPDVISIADYKTGRFTLMSPQRKYFWTGTVDEYIHEVARSRAEGMSKALAEAGEKAAKEKGKEKEFTSPKVDPAKLPPISITKTPITEKIAGYDTVKYEVRSDGELFQEIWVAPSLNVSSDLDVDRFLDFQRKMSAGMMGKAAGSYNALYLNDEYRKMLQEAFVLKLVTHHASGSFERTATSVRQADVAASQFEVPDAYRRVKLGDVLAPPSPQGS
jgi:hypothetical protein